MTNVDLTGKTILIGITGGVAAYKICELIRMYKTAGANVKVVCTPHALNFVTQTTLQTLSQNKIGIDNFSLDDYRPEHISYVDEADIFVIAPATANTISKLANGICDNLLTSTACAFRKPIILAPAMNSGMWDNPIIQENVNKLKKYNYSIVEPEDGFLACGAIGSGRLSRLENIFNKTTDALGQKKKLTGKKIVITAGGTIEQIDPVRYISNNSSGKMGLSLANQAHKMGANVVLITTKDFDCNYKVVKTKSAKEIQIAVEKEFEDCDCLIMAAAVADYRVKNLSEQKIKKTDDDEILIELIKNPDILKSICKKKTNQIVVGFCAESENLIQNAKEKIKNKGCDYLVANDISRNDIGFSSDFNEVHILSKTSEIKSVERTEKNLVAKKILEEIFNN
ncbi:MAG: bifunctional phosphopantothenoylcysteine decarboxylase/phosphopantothenate--cysteine ligase CoaBC [Candidatus Gastranaerophilales bacterium]